jgi:hypothetical protein
VRLQIGDEFRDPAPATPRGGARDRPAYRVTGVVRETPWRGLYEGKKLFTSYHFGRRKLEEAGEQEGLDVFLATVHYTALDDRTHIKDLREQAFFELQRVLGRGRKTRRAEDGSERVLGQPLSNLLPEPIDYLQTTNERDSFAVSNPRQLALYEPVLVFERIHGEPLDRWLGERSPALPRRLAVLADLLDFLAVLHAEGLLLNGLAPESVWIDEGDRLHYLGSDMVIDANRQKKQRRLYPPERYPPGFSPPELFDPEAPVGGGTDLYGWAALAYYLVTGDDPALLARRQGRPFARFEDQHFDRLQRELQQPPSASLPRLQQAFRISPPSLRGPLLAPLATGPSAEGSRFVHTWPDGFVGVLRECLHPQLARRPPSREALSGLWSGAKPRAVPAALAVRSGKHVEVLIAARAMEPGLEMVVRRATGFVPRHAQEGQLIAEGPLAVRALDRRPLPTGASRESPPCYAVFTRVRTEGEPVYSAPTAAPMLDLEQPAALLAFAEEVSPREATEGTLADRPTLPARVALLEELPDALPVARAWLGSSVPVIRRWALHLLEGQLRTPSGRNPALALLLERCVAEDRDDLRQTALRTIFQGERAPDPALVVVVLMTLGRGDVDASLRAAGVLEGLGLEEKTLAAARAAVERERTLPCPECQAPVRAADRDGHLKTRHGYVSLDGALLSYGDALRALWRRLFADQDEPAAVRLAQLFTDRHRDRAASAFATAFTAQLAQHAASLGDVGGEVTPNPTWERLGRCLAAHELTRRVCRELLANPDVGLRRLARLALIPVVAGRLTGRGATAELRSSLEALCPGEDVETRLAVCGRLQAAGASADAVRAVVKELEQEREIACPLCGLAIRRKQELAHLRSVHGVYEVDGSRLPWEEALDRLAKAMLSDPPTADSGARFVGVAADKLDSAGVTARVAEAVLQEAGRRGKVPDLSEVAGLPQGSEVVTRLIEPQPELALALFAAVGRQASLTLLERVAPLLEQEAVSEDRRLKAAELILSSANAEAGTRARALDRLVRGLGDPLAVMKRLEDLERSAGSHPLLEAKREQVRRTAKLNCPKCGTLMGLSDLEGHAWQTHRLVLVGGKWGEAWEVIEACLREYQKKPDDRLVERAVDLANRDDPKGGPDRLGRLARKVGLRHPLLPRTGWLDEQQVGQLKVLGWVAAALAALLALLWLLWR